MHTILRYARWHDTYPGPEAVTAVRFTGPDGETRVRPVFQHQSAAFSYDDHGYETITTDGAAVAAVRFTPDRVGDWRFAWLAGARVVREGAFSCTASNHPGYVEISRRDSHYFAFSNGDPYVAIGLNLCGPEGFALSSGTEFGTSGERGTLGAREFARWFATLAAHGGNFTRLWLGGWYFQAETEVAGELDPRRLAALDRVVELARQHGIRLKLCLEYFRCFGDGSFPSRVLRHPDDGRAPADMVEWFTAPEWQGLWRHKLDALLARYGDDPVVMAWELWNEINCCYTGDFAVQEAWTRRLLREVKDASPRTLVTNSLGSFDGDWAVAPHQAFTMPEMDFQQVHRYLDQGAPFDICRTDPVALSVDAVQRARRPDRPVLLAETGAVNDCHSGPFRYYRADHDGLIFHDTTYPAFFAGAAGSGHIWHWERYVDQKNLWYGFQALADALRGVAVDGEGLQPVDASTATCWCLLLRGRTVSLLWLRNKADRWDHVLRDGEAPEACPVALDLAALGIHTARVELFHPWPADGAGEAVIADGTLRLPPFQHGVVCRVWHGSS